MERSRKRDTPPTSRRSNINLADLRLSPLSVRYTESSKEHSKPDDGFTDEPSQSNHSSYIHGKSAPTSPGILSLSSSRKNLGAGLRRQKSLYDSDVQLEKHYERSSFDVDAGSTRRQERVAVGSGQIPKAKSEAALLVQRSKLASPGVQVKRYQKQYNARLRDGDSSTSLKKSKSKAIDEDWITRTGATANAFLQESKGQSWTISRESSTSITHLQDTTDDEDDEGYEELAAQSAFGSKLRLTDGGESPVSTRASTWGSRYGSRAASRRASRRGSMTLTTGSRTPLGPYGGIDPKGDYFTDAAAAMSMEPAFLDEDEEIDSQDETSLRELTETKSFGLGGIVDRLMHFTLFNVEEREESTEDEVERPSETAEQARLRMQMEMKRKREMKEKLTNRTDATTGDGNVGEKEGGWSDAAWLLSVASKAIF